VLLWALLLRWESTDGYDSQVLMTVVGALRDRLQATRDSARDALVKVGCNTCINAGVYSQLW
jgi:hypothetical protein